MNIVLNEPILADNYPMYYGYFYVADGEVIEAECSCTVAATKARCNYKEIRRCDLVGRVAARERLAKQQRLQESSHE